MVSPVRVRVPPLLFSSHLQEKLITLFAAALIKRGIHHNGHSIEVLREEVIEAEVGLTMYGGGDVSVGVGSLLDGGGPEHLRDELQLLPVLKPSRRSAIDPLLQMLRIAGALYRDLGNRTLDVVEIVGGEFDASRSDVLVEAVQLRGTGDRNDPRLLGKQPGDRDLGTRHPLLGCDFAEHLDQRLVRLSSLRREARNDVAEVGAVERRVLVDRAREEALAERAEGDEVDAELLERRQDLLLGLSPPQRIYALEGSDRLNGMGAPDGFLTLRT
jgi:chorismate mutase